MKKEFIGGFIFVLALVGFFIFLGNFNLTGNVVLNATTSGIVEGDNLTIYYNYSDVSSVIMDWRLNESSIAVLNMPFDTEIISSDLGEVKDYSLNGNDGTLGGGNVSRVPVWISDGKVAGGYNFDGLDDILKIEIDSSLAGFDVFTLESWIKFDSYAEENKSILFMDNRYEFFLESGEDYYLPGMNFYPGEEFSNIIVEIEDKLTDIGEWYHLVFTYDGSIGILYVDGINRKEEVDSGNLGGCESELYVGGNSLNYFNGSIDEVRIWNRALSSEQVLKNYNEGLSGRSIETIVNQEIFSGENWTVLITPNNVTGDWDSELSNSLVVTSSCEESLVNTSWSVWGDQTLCFENDTILQNRSLIQYDENNCGEISNVTFLGSREGDCNYCGAREIASRNSCSDGVCEVVGIDSCSILEGVSDSNIQLIGSSSSLDEVKSVKFLDGLDSFLEFEYDYSSSNLSYSNVEINKDSNSLIVDLSGVSITSKTIYLEDNNFVSLCVKDAFVESIDEISSECSENDEFDFSDCLDNSSGYIVDYITCTDLGDRIKIQNLSHSAVRGIPSGGSSLPITAEVIGEDSAGNVSENLEESVDGEEDDSLGEDIVDVGNENKTNYIFDINLEAVSKKNLGFGDNITFKVNVIKLIQGEAVDVIINYRLVDFNGNIVEEFNDTRRIETILEYIENFEIPLNLKKGKYKFQVGILYFDQIIDANISINVGQNFLERIFSVFDLYFGIISIVVLAFLIVLILKIHNRFKKDLIRFNGFFKNMFPFWNKSKKNIRVKR
ncbi:LamG domain-containing protein [archaeon]|jgi:hypothetical protein|nr:LamG domain-containing protein [archaeon]